MRLSVGQKLFLILLVATWSVVVVLMLFVTASFQFQSGFVCFVESRQQERLDRQKADLSALYGRDGGWRTLAGDKHRWGRLRFEGRDPGPQRRPPPPGLRPPGAGPTPGRQATSPARSTPGRLPPPRRDAAVREHGPDPTAWPPPAPPEIEAEPLQTLPRRLMLLDAQHELIFGRQDGAPGVAAADLAHLVERFYRVEASRNRAHGGAGLGLAI